MARPTQSHRGVLVGRQPSMVRVDTRHQSTHEIERRVGRLRVGTLSFTHHLKTQGGIRSLPTNRPEEVTLPDYRKDIDRYRYRERFSRNLISRRRFNTAPCQWNADRKSAARRRRWHTHNLDLSWSASELCTTGPRSSRCGTW